MYTIMALSGLSHIYTRKLRLQDNFKLLEVYSILEESLISIFYTGVAAITHSTHVCNVKNSNNGFYSTIWQCTLIFSAKKCQKKKKKITQL